MAVEDCNGICGGEILYGFNLLGSGLKGLDIYFFGLSPDKIYIFIDLVVYNPPPTLFNDLSYKEMIVSFTNIHFINRTIFFRNILNK